MRLVTNSDAIVSTQTLQAKIHALDTRLLAVSREILGCGMIANVPSHPRY